MYISDFSRSEGAGRATTRNTLGLTLSVIRLIVPPLPAVSRPSKTTQTLAPVAFTHSCMATSSPCRTHISFSYRFLFILRLTPASSRAAGDDCGSTFAPVDSEDSSAPLCFFSDFLPIWSQPFLRATEVAPAAASEGDGRSVR